ncbi:helix-turn-helix domain-containing protein [Brevibacterium sp. FAM 25378]
MLVFGCVAKPFTERTYASVTFKDIGEAAGVAVSSINTHFSSKLDMLKAA